LPEAKESRAKNSAKTTSAAAPRARNEYKLSPAARFDINEILLYQIRHRGEDAAFELEGDFIEAFERLAENPGLGHSRENLTSNPDLFYLVDPYLIVYDRQSDPLGILRVLHSARDLKKLLKTKPEK
jgi:plasmid stabilization system protein ParE